MPERQVGRDGSTPSFTRSGRPSASFLELAVGDQVHAAAREHRRVGRHRAAMLPAVLPRSCRNERYTRPPMTRRHFPLAALLTALAVCSAACGVHLEDVPRRQLAQTSFVYAADDQLITALHAVEDRIVLPHPRDPRLDPRRGRRDRGSTVLPPPRRRRSRDPPRVVREPPRRADRGGRLHDHPAAREEPVHGRRPDVGRKLSEAMLAWQLEDRLSKDEILTRYLNTVYFGQGAYGVQAAAARSSGSTPRSWISPGPRCSRD